MTLGTIFPIYFRCQTQIEPRIGRDAFRYFDLLSTAFSLKYKVSPFIRIFRVAYMVGTNLITRESLLSVRSEISNTNDRRDTFRREVSL